MTFKISQEANTTAHRNVSEFRQETRRHTENKFSLTYSSTEFTFRTLEIYIVTHAGQSTKREQAKIYKMILEKL